MLLKFLKCFRLKLNLIFDLKCFWQWSLLSFLGLNTLMHTLTYTIMKTGFWLKQSHFQTSSRHVNNHEPVSLKMQTLKTILSLPWYTNIEDGSQHLSCVLYNSIKIILKNNYYKMSQPITVLGGLNKPDGVFRPKRKSGLIQRRMIKFPHKRVKSTQCS